MSDLFRKCLIAGAVAVIGSLLGSAAESDALAISSNIQARHVPYGAILDPVYAAPNLDDLTGYTRCGDSALWTGTYLAAEAFRYKVTGSQDALANAKNAFAGIKGLADVTGYNLLARCMIPLDSPYAPNTTGEQQSNGIYTNSSAGWYWIGNTSRDEYSGVFFGLAVAYDMIDDSNLKSEISALVTRLLDYLRGHGWTVFNPDGSLSTTFIIRADQQLSFLQVGRHVNPNHYSTSYDVDKIFWSAEILAPIGVDVLSNDSYFKFNLDYMNLYNLIRLESSSFKDIYEQAYSVLRNHTDDQKNAHFNMIDLALNGPDASRDTDTASMLSDWLQRPRRDIYMDLRNVFPSCNSPDEACNPVPVPRRPTTDFLWQRNPYQLDGGGGGIVEGAGIDYILPYWMARYYNLDGIEAPAFVVSGASFDSAVAEQSVVNFYGAALAGNETAQPPSLPNTLGGISVQVQDSAGATRMAPISFTSLSQVTFQIPAGTATGQATITILNGDGSTAASGAANVNTVAPGLFTAYGNGAGAAAGIVTQTASDGTMSSSPSWQCTAGTCTTVPIPLSGDNTTTLTLPGTGIRNRSSIDNVSVTINGQNVPVLSAGPQDSDGGLDQVVVSLPQSLAGTGETNLQLTVDGQAANVVRVDIQ
ncbi:MAG TPA: hypothetical protein VKU01_17555 [Bryobacteraceae bacterium]|nr:hypothetical protein [Bryobacteraceae bacterium]